MKMELDHVMHSRHDLFNLFALPVVVFHLCNFLVDIQSDTENYINVFLVGELYFVVDLVWLLIWPASVVSPRVIIFHHVVSCVGWCLPLYRKEMAPYAAACLLVEVNTFFLISKRYFRNSPTVHNVANVLFHLSWIVLRLIVYPVVCYKYSFEVHRESIRAGSILNLSSIAMFVVIILTSLNIKWTWDLYFQSTWNDDLKKGL